MDIMKFLETTDHRNGFQSREVEYGSIFKSIFNFLKTSYTSKVRIVLVPDNITLDNDKLIKSPMLNELSEEEQLGLIQFYKYIENYLLAIVIVPSNNSHEENIQFLNKYLINNSRVFPKDIISAGNSGHKIDISIKTLIESCKFHADSSHLQSNNNKLNNNKLIQNKYFTIRAKASLFTDEDWENDEVWEYNDIYFSSSYITDLNKGNLFNIGDKSNDRLDYNRNDSTDEIQFNWKPAEYVSFYEMDVYKRVTSSELEYYDLSKPYFYFEDEYSLSNKLVSLEDNYLILRERIPNNKCYFTSPIFRSVGCYYFLKAYDKAGNIIKRYKVYSH